MAASQSLESIDQDFETSMTDISVTETGSPQNQFTNVSLDNVESGSSKSKKKKKVPRKILHFSDGILEEYSTDEDDIEEEIQQTPTPVDPKSLAWLPWIWYHLTHSAVSALGVADNCGEKLAWFFGITSPKYQSAIDEYERMRAEEEEERKERELEAQEAHRVMERAEAGMPDVSVMNKKTGTPLDSQQMVVEKY